MDNYKSWYHSVKGALNILHHNSIHSSQYRRSRGRELAGKHDIDLAFLEQLWQEQDGRCYYSNIPMMFVNNEWRVSLERLDNNQGYIRGNVVLCCIEFNTKSQWSISKVDHVITVSDSNIANTRVTFTDTQKKKYTKHATLIDNGITSHKCTYCENFKSIDSFHKDVSRGCKICVKKRTLDRTPKQVLQHLLITAKNSARLRAEKQPMSSRGICDIVFEDLIELYNKQKGLCAYSGLPLQFGSYLDKDWVASLERIDPLNGYTKDNICLICIEFNSCDQTVKTGSSYGSAGWTPLKFQYFLAHAKHKRGLISDEELQAVVDIQVRIKSRPNGTARRYTRHHVQEVITNTLAQKKREYGSIYSITSPSGKTYIGSTDVLFQPNQGIFARIRKYRYKAISAEIAKYGEAAMIVTKLASCRKEKLEEFQQYFITTFNTCEPNGLNSKRKMSKQACEKISDTLTSKKVRLNHDDSQLPKYIKFINWADRRGYAIVNHPQCKLKYFVSKSKPLQELYSLCLEYMRNLLETE